MTNSRGRMLFGAPMLLQDWDQEAQHAFQYWELFLDLLLVAAASAVTDQFKENLNSFGFGEFLVFYVSILNGWLLYTHHITSRFQDPSLLHSLNLFLYCVGFGLCNVNTGYKTVVDFCKGALLLRAAILIMLASLAYNLQRARYVCSALGTVTGITMVGYLVVAILCSVGGYDIQDQPIIMAIFWLSAGLEFFGEIIMVYSLQGNLLVPINIEQTKERLGAMELIFLGETVLSVTLIYREMTGEEEEEEEHTIEGEEPEEEIDSPTSFYWVLGWSFLLIFMFLLLYFHMQPAKEDHALRRSRAHGTSLMILHKIMGLAFLSVGVSVKLVVESVLEKEEMPQLASRLMAYAVSAAVFLLFVMRYLHYGARDTINFGDHLQMHYGVDHYLDNVTMMWWWTVGLAGFVPLVGVVLGWTVQQDPVVLTASHAIFMFLLVAAESYYSHLIMRGLTRQEVSRGQEGEPLISSSSGNADGNTTYS